MKSVLLSILFLSSFNIFADEMVIQKSTTSIDEISKTASTKISIDKTTDLIDKPLSITFFSLGGVTDQQLKFSDPSADFFDNYISFNYKINQDFRISARPAFGYSMAGNNYRGESVTNSIRTRDFSFVAKFNNLLEDFLMPSLDLSHQFRLYLPTSDFSKETGMIARLRYELEGRYSLAKHSNFRCYVKPSYYFQRSTVYLDNSNPRYLNSVKTTPKIDMEHGAEFSFGVNKILAVKPGFEIQEKWSNTSVAENKDEYHATTARTGIGLEVRPSRDFNFTIAIASNQDLITTSKSAETGYTLMTNVALF